MKKAEPPQGKWWNVVFFLAALVVLAADQSSKMGIRSYPEGQSIFEAGFFRLTHVRNTGAAFGLFQDQSFRLTIVAIIGVIAILAYALLFSRRFSFLENRSGKLALGLVLGGTVGNLVDRLRLGYVTDFIDVGIWPAFNIADSAIVGGVILLAYSLRSLSRATKSDLSV